MSWYVAPTLDVLLEEINASAPGRDKASDGSIGDPNHSSRESDHNPDDKGCVHARDFTHDPAAGFDSFAFADWIRQRVNNSGMHIGYVISNGRIFNPDISAAWRTYTGSNPHDHHAHVSIRYDHREDDRSPWGWSGAGPQTGDDDMTPEQAATLDNIAWTVGQMKPTTDRLPGMNSTLDNVNWGLLDENVGTRVMVAQILAILDDGR